MQHKNTIYLRKNTMTRSRLKHLSRCKPTLSYTKLKKNAQNNVMIYIFQFDTTLSPAPKNFGRVVPRQMNILKPNSRSMLCASYSEKRSFDAWRKMTRPPSYSGIIQTDNRRQWICTCRSYVFLTIKIIQSRRLM